MTARTTRLVMTAAGASGISCVLLLVQVQEPHQKHYWYMLWNLMLAWIPMVLAIAYGIVAVPRTRHLLSRVLFAAWLLFLPNAPYLATDLIHLRDSRAPPALQYVMFAAFTVAGLVLGLGSAYLVHCALLDRGNRRNVVVIYGCLVLCGIGLYVGRVLQMNSWDILVAPDGFAGEMGRHLDSVGGVVDAALFVASATTVLIVAYYVFWRCAGGAKTRW